MAQVVIAVASQADAIASRSIVRAFLRERGAPTTVQAEIVVVVAELASNLWRHAGSGVIRLSAAEGAASTVLIEAQDEGTGLPAHAFDDGFSTGGSLGAGLGAVWRLADTLEVASGSGGTLIRAWKRLGSM